MYLLLQLQRLLDLTRALDFLAPLALRLYLAPIFWMAGTNKLSHFGDTAAWFGNPDWGLGLPLPNVMAALALASEIAGSIFLLFGFGVRWVSVPLMVTMIVASFAVHWKHGWQAVADTTFCLFNCADAQEAATRLARAKEILQEHGDYEWLTEQGSFVVLNNGIEFAATYFIMLLTLFFVGAGRYVSLDYWIRRWTEQRV
jgi:putative oxidoreductase